MKYSIRILMVCHTNGSDHQNDSEPFHSVCVQACLRVCMIWVPFRVSPANRDFQSYWREINSHTSRICTPESEFKFNYQIDNRKSIATHPPWPNVADFHLKYEAISRHNFWVLIQTLFNHFINFSLFFFSQWILIYIFA